MFHAHRLSLIIVATCIAVSVHAANMIGPQSQNEGMLAVPAPGNVAIDGSLDDWDFSGRIWVIPHISVRGQYSSEVATMWDQDYLYIALKWKDPTPMYSTVDPAINPGDGWKADCAQFNISTDQSMWVFAWYYEPEKQPAMRFTFWKEVATYRKGQTPKLYMAEPGGTSLGDGIEMAHKAFPEGDGYVQEIRIPWDVLYKEKPEIAPKLIFRMGMELLWGDPTGNTWPTLRYADNMQQGKTSREFFWAGSRDWGNVELIGENNIEKREYISADDKLQGTIPIRLNVPQKAQRFTVVIESQEGKRIRNLAADFDPIDYQVDEGGNERVVEVLWDGLDDRGAIVEPGTFKVRGLYHNGLDARYEMTFYNPGTPPWETKDTSGGWGADHSAPRHVARTGDRMIAGWGFAEGGHGIIGIGADGLKKWGEKRGASFLTADETYIYATPVGSHSKGSALMRMKAKDGSYAPFVLNGKERPFELKSVDIFGDDIPGDLTDLAVHDDTLAIGMSDGVVALLDATTAVLKKRLAVPGIGRLAYGQNGTLYGIAGGKIVAIDTAVGTHKALPIKGIGKANAITVDNAGNILIADTGADMQVKAFAENGSLVYTCGRKGGRPLRGAYDPMGMYAMNSIAVDAYDDVWVAEYNEFPRRISVWGRDGALIRDYMGNTEYAGTGAFLHRTDPHLAYLGPLEFRLDKENRDARLTRVLWKPHRAEGESFEIDHNSHANNYRFTSDISGTNKEYYVDVPYRTAEGFVFFMENNDVWRPVSAVTTVARIACDLDGRGYPKTNPEGEWADCDAFDGVFWNDENGDGKVQRSECEIVKAERPFGTVEQRKRSPQPGIPLRGWWGTGVGDDFVFYGYTFKEPLTEYKPIGFSKDGAPRYGTAGMRKTGIQGSGDIVPVTDEKRVLIMPASGGLDTVVSSYDPATEDLLWSYPNPYPGVHGSHKATMAAPGLLIGSLKILGVAEANDNAGKVFVMRGNLGQDFFMTTDGLYVGALFQDGRLPNMTLPDSEEQLANMPMSPFTEGGEPFNGCFVKQNDGKFRMTTGMARQGAMIIEILGLKSIKRFQLDNVEIDAELLAKADKDNIARAAALELNKEIVIRRLSETPKINGDGREYVDVAHIDIERQGMIQTGQAKVAYDDTNLYLYYKVIERSPWKNEAKDFTRLFKTGDAVDFQLCVDPEAAKDEKRRNPGQHDIRISISQLGKNPVVVLMKPVDKDAPDSVKHTYVSSVTEKPFDRVELLEDAQVKVRSRDDQYELEAAIPLAKIGLKPAPGLTLRGDIGFILSDADGTINTARVYWSNKDTNLVNDESFEAWIYPATWGTIRFE